MTREGRNVDAGSVLFAHVAQRPDDEIDLAAAALLVAEAEYPNLDVGHYLAMLDGMADAVKKRVGPPGPGALLGAMTHYLFEELGFRGNDEDYYDPKNSFLNEVLERRTGIPISLALVLIEVCQRVGIDARGVSFPGHFLVRIQDDDGDLMFIDPFDGRLLDDRHLAELHPSKYGALLDGVETVAITDIRPLTDENVALRMVVLADRMYDRNLPLLAGGVPLDQLFSPEMLKGGYRKKYLRALSRLIALTREQVDHAAS